MFYGPPACQADPEPNNQSFKLFNDILAVPFRESLAEECYIAMGEEYDFPSE